MPLKAIVFDVSGTLLNDIEVVWKANSDAYSAFGFWGFDTLEQFKEKFRMPVPEFHKANGIPLNLISEVDKKFREVYPRYASRITIFPEVESVLKELISRKITLGIASSIPTIFLREHLEHFEIESYFTIITGQEDCDEQKPSPKPILYTLKKLGIKPEEAIYVGDMEEDMIAGRAANTLTAAIVRNESYHPRWRLEKQKPDYIISSLQELLIITQTGSIKVP